MANIKLVVEISEEVYNNLKIGCTQRVSDGEMIEAIKNGTPIPDNATNGDVIKAMFPTADISLNDSCFEGVVNKYGFDMKWWNAPYQKGGK